MIDLAPYDGLIACEYSGIVRDAFIAQGLSVISCDLLDTERSGPHYRGPIEDILFAKDWAFIIAHPPCTYLANSGVCWLHKYPERWAQLDDGAAFFKMFLDHPCKIKCIENPIPHKYAVERIGRKYDQLIQPYHFGHLESKATCFWLEGLPHLEHTFDLKEISMSLPVKQRQRLHWIGSNKIRAKERSKTFEGIADAMAEQWAPIIKEKLYQ